MKNIFKITILCSSLFIWSCTSSSSSWENVKTAGRYLQKGIDSLWGKDHESCIVKNENDFIGPDEEEFIPMSDEDLKNQLSYTDKAIAQPKYSPGEYGIPSIQNFKAASNGVFKILHFETDDHVIREKDDLVTISKIVHYLKKHPNTYLCIDGHCDERASAAYNMALGTRRANHVRVLMIKQGVDFNRIYTISHGKEKPIALGHGSEDWKQNRRVEFKIHEKK